MTTIKNLFQQCLQQAQAAYGINSPQYQQLKKEQKETMAILEKASSTEQEQYLALIQQLQPFLTKMPNLSEPEQQRLLSLAQEADEFTEKLKKDQQKTGQQQKTNKIMWIGGGLLGIGLVGIIIYFLTRKENK